MGTFIEEKHRPVRKRRVMKCRFYTLISTVFFLVNLERMGFSGRKAVGSELRRVFCIKVGDQHKPLIKLRVDRRDFSEDAVLHLCELRGTVFALRHPRHQKLGQTKHIRDGVLRFAHVAGGQLVGRKRLDVFRVDPELRNALFGNSLFALTAHPIPKCFHLEDDLFDRTELGEVPDLCEVGQDRLVDVGALGRQQNVGEGREVPVGDFTDLVGSLRTDSFDRGEARINRFGVVINRKENVNFTTQTVTVIPTSQIFEVDSLFLAGSAIAAETKIEPTLENPEVYAWRGELAAGKLYIPVSFNEAKNLSIVPAGDSHEIADGTAVAFGQALTTQTGAKYWEIATAGIYRIVVDTDAKTIKIYSPATDPKNKQVSFNNTVDKINPYTMEVTELWMWGGFNAADKDSDLKAGFQRKYTLKQSLANPAVFVYKGDALPRESGNYNSKNSVTGATSGAAWLTFLVTSLENNVYAFGSTADAKRNDHTGTVEPALGETVDGIGGQGDHRYSYFVIPEGANFVIVDLSEMSDEVSPANNTAVNAKVTFDKR